MGRHQLTAKGLKHACGEGDALSFPPAQQYLNPRSLAGQLTVWVQVDGPSSNGKHICG